MENFNRLKEIKDELEYLEYKNKKSVTHLRNLVKEVRQIIEILKLTTLGFTVDEETENYIKKDLEELKCYESPKKGFEVCLDDLVPDLQKIIDEYSLFIE